MRNRGVILSIIIALVSTMLLPFSISAESGSLSAPFVGFNVHIMDIDAEYKYIDSGNYSISSQGGSITGQLNCSSWRSGSSSDGPCDVYELEDQSNSYVNGLKINLSGLTLQNVTNDAFTGTIYKRIYEIEFVLDDSYVGSVTFSANSQTYTSYVNGTSFHQNFWSDSAESFTISITDYSLSRNQYRQWDYPIESFNIIQAAFQNNLSLSSLQNYSDYVFPVFSLENGQSIGSFRFNPNNSFYFIFFFNRTLNSTSVFSQYFDVDGLTVDNLTIINRFVVSTYLENIVIVQLTNNTGSAKNFNITYIGNSGYLYMPIYMNITSNKYVSTDFALRFGLSNSLLDNLNILANGTYASNQSASNVDNSNSQLTDQITQYNNTETQFNNNMNSALNNINLDNNLPSAMGSKFMSSATWVRNQFIRMTNNNPFGSVLGFSLTVGIALLVLGKISK